MGIILGCTRDTTFAAVRYLLAMPTTGLGARSVLANAYIHIVADEQLPLHKEIRKSKGIRFKSGKIVVMSGGGCYSKGV